MKKKLKIMVDTGSVYCIFSLKKTKKSIPLKKGKYLIQIKANGWNGPNSNYGFVEAKADGFLNFNDYGILIDEEKEIFLPDEKLHKRGVKLSTGGDGSFMVSVLIKKTSKIGPNPYSVVFKKAKLFFKKNKFNEQTSKKFCDLFLTKAYYSKINEILQKENNKQLKSLLKEVDSVLKSLKE